MKLLFWSAIVLMASLGPARAAPFTGLVVLGDSLSDQGNAGRFSDGPVWVEGVAQALGLPLRPARLGGDNYAVGGARVAEGPSSLEAQAEALLKAKRGRLDAGVLHVVWGGANDLLWAGTAADPGRQAGMTAAAVARIVERLAKAGAGAILVANLPDIGMTPALRAQGPAWMAGARRLSQAYNAALTQALDAVEGWERVRLYRLDVWALGERVLADPAAHGFKEVTRPCGGRDCATALFWDQIHPTAAAHAGLARTALGVLGAPG